FVLINNYWKEGVDGREPLEGIPTVFDRHHQVEQHNVYRALIKLFDRLVTVCRTDQLESLGFDHAAEGIEHGEIIVNEEDLGFVHDSDKARPAEGGLPQESICCGLRPVLRLYEPEPCEPQPSCRPARSQCSSRRAASRGERILHRHARLASARRLQRASHFRQIASKRSTRM